MSESESEARMNNLRLRIDMWQGLAAAFYNYITTQWWRRDKQFMEDAKKKYETETADKK